MATEDEKSGQLKKFVDAHARKPGPAGKALGHLFPKYARVFEAFQAYSGPSADASRFRLSNKDYASSYFRLNPRTTLWRKEELDQLFHSDDPQLAMSDAENKIAASPESDHFALRRMLLDQMELAFDKGEIKLSEEWLDAIVAHSPTYILANDELSQEMFSTDFITRLERIIFRGLRSLSNNERVNVFKRALKAASDISLLCSMFRTIAGDVQSDEGEERDSGEFDFGSETASLRESLVDRVRLLADDGSLWAQADPERLLWFWAGAGHRDEVIRFTYGAMENPIALRVLLDKTVSLVRSTAGNYERVPRYTEKILDLSKLEQIALGLAKGSPTRAETQLARRFLAALERGKKEPD